MWIAHCSAPLCRDLHGHRDADPRDGPEQRRARKRGIARGDHAVIVTHRIAELIRVADRATVLRDGAVVGDPVLRGTAQNDILSPEGKVMEKAGAVRDGGSFQERMGKVACWNSVMDEDRYMIQKWNEFIAA